MNGPRISIIVAHDDKRGIGQNNRLPWHIPEDLKRFKDLTMGHPIVMGRKTFEHIGRVLPGRTSIVISRNPSYRVPAGVRLVGSLEDGVRIAAGIDRSEICIIGGAQIYAQALVYATRLYVTRVHGVFPADAYFPDYPGFVDVSAPLERESDGYRYTFHTMERQ